MKNPYYDTAAWLSHIEEGIARGPYSADWDSLSAFRAPDWFARDKFGIFLHWGLYSVPAFRNEWYSRNMYIQGTPEFEHHVKTYGPQKEFGYKDFIPLFRAENFDPDEWIRIFQDAGARYIMPVAEHHDGFQMYESALSPWNAAEMGPKRDILGELKKAAEKKEMHFCASSHRAEHWWFMGHGKEFDSDVKEPMKLGDFYWPAMPEPENFDMQSRPYPTDEYLTDWLIRTVELIDRCSPELLYFDWWIGHEAFKPYLPKLMAYYYNHAAASGRRAAVCGKLEDIAFGTGITEVERGGFADAKAFPWQTDTAVARNSWCYTTSLDYKSSREIIGTLIDVVSRNGNLLLNVGPAADGSIPEGDRRILTDVGEWLRVNGEAVYDSRVWRITGEGPTKDQEGAFSDGTEKTYTEQDIRFTTGHGAIYAFAMHYPKDGKLLIRSLPNRDTEYAPRYFGIIREVRILGKEDPVQFSRTDEGLLVQAEVESEMPVVVKIISS